MSAHPWWTAQLSEGLYRESLVVQFSELHSRPRANWSMRSPLVRARWLSRRGLGMLRSREYTNDTSISWCSTAGSARRKHGRVTGIEVVREANGVGEGGRR